VLLLSSTLANCAPAASTAPLANAEPEGPDVYFYGDASNGGKDVPETDSEQSKPEAAASATSPSEKGENGKAAGSSKSTKSNDAADEAGEATASLPVKSFADLPGRYAGTDTLKINVDGTPERVETDDGAKLTVEKAADGRTDAYVFKIVDSQSGSDLCSVTGVAKKRAIEFEPGQTCLDTILGVPMTAKLTSGSAKLDGKKLVVDYVIDLEVDAPQGAVEGKIDYHFGGTRE
jgi:hypothetical protein